MSKRRTNAEIQEIEQIHNATSDVARGIMDRVDPTDETAISVRAQDYWNSRADWQRGAADTIVVSFVTKDPAEAERVALAIRNALKGEA
jgi:hypothetical protein